MAYNSLFFIYLTISSYQFHVKFFQKSIPATTQSSAESAVTRKSEKAELQNKVWKVFLIVTRESK